MNFLLVLHLRKISAAATTIKAIKHPTATTTGTAITTGCVADCPPEKIKFEKEIERCGTCQQLFSYQFALQQEHLC